MFHRIRIGKFAIGLAAFAVALTLACNVAEAKPRPWNISGAGVAPSGIPLPGGGAGAHWAVGTATHLGKYAGLGAVQTDSATFHGDGTITGEFGSAVPFVFVGANGDVLSCHYGRADLEVAAGGAVNPGTFELIPVGGGFYVAFWVAEFVPVVAECTGKFAGIGGSWIMYAMSEPFELGATDPVAYMWAGKGTLDFKD